MKIIEIIKFFKKPVVSFIAVMVALSFVIFLTYHFASKTFYEKLNSGDDLEQLIEASILKSNPAQIFNIKRYSAAAGISTHYTPLLYVFWISLLTFFGDNAHPYLVFGFIIHALNAILLFLIIMKLSHNKTASFLGTGLFLLLPGNLLTVGWVSASLIYTTMVFFMLLTLIFFIEYLDKRKRVYFFLSLFFYLCGCISKQIFYPFFLILAAYEILIFKKSKKGNELKFKKVILKYIPFVVLSLIFFLIQIYRYKMGWIYQLKGGALFSPIIIYRLFDFLKEFLLPYKTESYYLKFFLISFLFFSFYYLFFYTRNNFLKFSIIWIVFLGLLPMTQHLRSISESIRYIYPISPGFCMLVAFLGSQRKKLILIPLVLLIIYLCALNNVF